MLFIFRLGTSELFSRLHFYLVLPYIVDHYIVQKLLCQNNYYIDAHILSIIFTCIASLIASEIISEH